MDVTVRIPGESASEDVRALRRWLVVDDEFRGRVSLVDAAPQPGRLGVPIDMLAVSLGSGGALTTLVSALVAWIRHRTGDISIVVQRPDGGSIEVSAQRLRGMDPGAVRTLVDDLAQKLSGGQAADHGEDSGGRG
jgi:Effector Associated Constant Component 1